MGEPMGLQFGLGGSQTCFKRKFRWLFKIDDISASGVKSLPPLKSARPSMTFKEMEVQHLNETFFYPSKPDWKPITLVLYDLARPIHPVFAWFQQVYNPCDGKWSPSGSGGQTAVAGPFKKNARLELLSGCGDILEMWFFENAWPQTVEFGELDMSSSEYVTAEITLRYDRAFVVTEC